MHNQTPHILLVEDNLDLRDDLCFQLKRQGYTLDTAGSAKEMDVLLHANHYEIAVIDIGLPGEDGLSIARRLRNIHPHLGIIFMTARGEIETKIQGLSIGADSYLVKPVDVRELIAVIQALYNRIQSLIHPGETWRLDSSMRVLFTPHSESIQLTHMEGQLLRLLAQSPKNPVSREQLIAVIAGDSAYSFDPRRIEVCMSRLRRKILDTFCNSETDNPNAQDKIPVKAARGIGYVFTENIIIE
jgi:two-component system OmpR family response regulator